MYSTGLHPHLSSVSSIYMVASGKLERWASQTFLLLSSYSETSPGMGSFCPISLEQTWLAVSSEGIGSACLGFLLALSSFGPAGNVFRGAVLGHLSRACFSSHGPSPLTLVCIFAIVTWVSSVLFGPSWSIGAVHFLWAVQVIGVMSCVNGAPGLILPSCFGTCARGHWKLEQEDILEKHWVQWSYEWL